MSRRVLARPLAAATLASALVLTPTLATADPGGNGQGAEQGKAAQAPGQAKDKPAKPGKGKSGEAGKENAPGQVKGDGPATGKGQDGAGQGSTGGQPGTQPQAPTGGDSADEDTTGGDTEETTGGEGGAQDGDPAGNNGTVKIAALGDLDSIPNNTPHPGCSFQVEWYGFDEGEDVVSTVTFTAHAPTSDVVIGGTSPSEVFVGGDPASGAGTETGLDGRQVYDLTFEGEPHPKQGYHVKLTVSTPRSLGNDTKTKVFWVAPCEEDAATGGTTEDEATGTADDAQATGVLGTQLAAVSAPIASLTSLLTNPAVGANARGVASDTSAVPTSVDAGAEGGLSALTDSPLPLGLLVAALLASAAAVVVGRRSSDADA